MLKNIIEDEDFKNLSQKCIKDIVQFIIEKDIEFSIIANIKSTTFNPELPEDIKQNLNQFSLFTLAGYTFSTIKIDENYFYFEAGFGKNNFGSVVKIPLYSIFQIIVNENILYINMTATVEKFNTNFSNNSFNAFANNPKNKKFT